MPIFSPKESALALLADMPCFMTYFTDEARVDASSVSTVNDVDVGTSDTRKSPLLLLFVSVNLI